METLYKIEQSINKISGAVGWLAGWLCVLMIGVVFIDVIARYFFHGGSIAMQELEWHLFAAVFLLGAAYVIREDANVRADIIYARLTPRHKAIIDICGYTIFVIPMSTLILYSSWDFVSYSYQLQETSSDPGGLPYRFIFKALLPIGYGLVLIQSFAEILRNIRSLTNKHRPALTDYAVPQQKEP